MHVNQKRESGSSGGGCTVDRQHGGQLDLEERVFANKHYHRQQTKRSLNHDEMEYPQPTSLVCKPVSDGNFLTAGPTQSPLPTGFLPETCIFLASREDRRKIQELANIIDDASLFLISDVQAI